MREALVILTATALLSIAGCATEQQQEASNNQDAQQALDSAHAYCDSLAADPILDPIRSKVALKGEPLTFDMISNEERATDSERPVIREWANRSIQCQQKVRRAYQQYTPPMHAALYDSLVDATNGLRVELHNGQLTYGQYNRERQKLVTEFEAAWAKLNAELAQQNAYLAQQIFQEYYQTNLILQQSFQQQQQAFQQRLLQQQQQHGTVTCTRIGASTYCNY